MPMLGGHRLPDAVKSPEAGSGHARGAQLRGLERLVGPALCAASESDRVRILSLAGMLFIATLGFSVAVATAPRVGGESIRPFMAPLAVLSGVLLWLLRRRWSADRVGRVFLASVFAFFAATTLATGGTATSVLFSASAIPVMAGLLHGPKAATFWAATGLVVIAATLVTRNILGPDAFPYAVAPSIEALLAPLPRNLPPREAD